MGRVGWIVGVMALLASMVWPHGGAAASGAPDDRPALAVSVSETAQTVRLRMHLGADVDPGSVEVRLEGREVTVRARSTGGQVLPAATLSLRDPAVEDGATAEYDGEGWLTITLQKRDHTAAR